MSDTVENLVVDLLEWLERKERPYQETKDASHFLFKAPSVGSRERTQPRRNRFATGDCWFA